MKYAPHKYQEVATDFIINKPISAILLECGLGKSIITLTAINDLMLDSFDVSKVLIIAPLRVAKTTWKDEIKKWEHLNLLEYSIIVGSKKEREQALNKKAHIYIINRENIDWLITKSGYKFDFDMLVIDELSSFKNGQSKRFKSLLKVRPKIKRVVGLTGTPSSNGLMDLWAEFKILDMGERLEKYITHYRNKYFLPDKRNGMQIFSYKPMIDSEERIYDKISDITISMKAKDHLKMPELVINEVKVSMDNNERAIYEELKKKFVVEVAESVKNRTYTTEIDAVNAAVLSGKLLQLASGNIYDEDRKSYHIHDRKLDALEDLIEGANGKPVLVAYWYGSDKERIMKRFSVREIKTEQDIRDWNDGKIPVAIIHPASAGHGLNLQIGGATLIWFSLIWSLELYQQTNARLYRQGQKDTVVIHHIICSGTIDEDVMKALQRKEKIQDALMNAVKAQIKE
ncbi:DEAD/DEAH box helicase [Ligilactobacillus ceti]|uniref:SNF2 domain-containing protein n=1 Tax=Ligilactobacillus ceti DSM 22408 TaxID=1122146 RepID=A0A0R2KP16_9LACO|nr:DEAD/DEAH box helicase [Ligilactobacillus ceti]KRN88716.1 SNF2 domain-containing protein [Ligilactobacillus ceti DSM 22408]